MLFVECTKAVLETMFCFCHLYIKSDGIECTCVVLWLLMVSTEPHCLVNDASVFVYVYLCGLENILSASRLLCVVWPHCRGRPDGL